MLHYLMINRRNASWRCIEHYAGESSVWFPYLSLTRVPRSVWELPLHNWYYNSLTYIFFINKLRLLLNKLEQNILRFYWVPYSTLSSPPLCLVSPCEFGRISVFEKIFIKKIFVKNYAFELTVNKIFLFLFVFLFKYDEIIIK